MKKLFVLILFIMIILFVTNLNNYDIKSEINNKVVNELNNCDASIDFDSPETYDITLLVKLNTNAIDTSKNNINNEAGLRAFRNSVKNYYIEENNKIVQKIDLNNYNYDISYYAPFLEIVFDNISEYENEKDVLISSLANNDEIESISINYVNFDTATVNSSASLTNYPLSSAIADIGIPSSLSYTGNGVNVGTIEKGTPDSTANLINDKFTRLSTTTTEHSTWVTSIIGGTSGIAQDVHLYCIGKSDYSNFTTCVNTLVGSCNVDIINMSYSFNNSGCYDNYCKYIDYIVKNTYCTFVQSAGNNGPSIAPNISSPGCGMNVITVGSIAANKNVSYFSSWYTSNNYLLKPNMVAPGENISNVPNLSGTNSGTSFSAPMVTGIVALLMEEFPALKTNPSLVKAALEASCELLPSQTDYFESQCGFGLVNYQNARNYLYNSQYNNFYIPENGSNGDIIASYNVSIPASTKIEINVDWMINSSSVNPDNNSCTPFFTKCYVKLYDVQNSAYVKSDTKNTNMGYMEYINGGNSTKQYRIDVVINGQKATGGIELGSLIYNLTAHTHDFSYASYNNTYHIKTCDECEYHVYENHHYQVVGSNNVCSECGHTVSHIHDYTYSYSWINYNQHKAFCACGGFNNELHVVSAKSLGDGLQYVTCILCGGPANAGIVPGFKGIQITENGSFISPNGTLVLVDEDIDCYLGGTLVFIDPNTDLLNNYNNYPYLLKREDSYLE